MGRSRTIQTRGREAIMQDMLASYQGKH